MNSAQLLRHLSQVKHEISILFWLLQEYKVSFPQHSHHQHQDTPTERKIMAALDNLNAAVTKLQNSVDAAVTEITTPHPTDAAVQSAADAVSAQADRLDAAVTSQAGTPPPTPPPAG